MPRFSKCWRCENTVGIGIICDLCGVAKYCSEKCQKNDIFRHEAECIPASILKTCTTCRKSGQNLKTCTGCYQAFYCDAKCQKSNWERHKIDCLEEKTTMEARTQLILIHFSDSEIASVCKHYYWGNVPAIDCLNLVENEGASYALDLKVLILGVGDLRNVALTCASLPNSYSNKIWFTLNDRESCVLARLLMLLYMLIKGDSAMEKTVTEIWYSVVLTKAAYKSLRSTLEELGSFTSSEQLRSKTAGLISVNQTHFKQLQDVWKTWLNLRVRETKWIQKQRHDAINSGIEVVARNSAYIKNVPAEHACSLKKWIEDGVFKRSHAPTFAENPTLTGVDSTTRYAPYTYGVPPECFPFSGWDYLQVKKFKSSNCIVTMYGDYIEFVLRNFMKKLLKQQVTFSFVLCDCMDIKQHLEVDPVYDRVLTSNLMDYIFLPNLLKLCSQILNYDNDHATVITETMRWERDLVPEADLEFPSNALQRSKLLKIALEDTKRSSFAAPDGGASLKEYVDNSHEFFNYLRAIFYAQRFKREAESGSTSHKPTIPTIKELGNEFQLRLRNGIQDENRIVFFRWAINRRRVTVLTGRERFLEWEPLQKK